MNSFASVFNFVFLNFFVKSFFSLYSLAEATASFYHDTIQTCFGSQDVPSEENTCLPSCVDVNHTNCYYLNSMGKRLVGRILTCFAYNQPDMQYCPMLYSITSILSHYLSGNFLV